MISSSISFHYAFLEITLIFIAVTASLASVSVYQIAVARYCHFVRIFLQHFPLLLRRLRYH